MSWDEVEEQITYPRLEAFYAYWKKNPPTHIIAAALAGIKTKG